MLPASFGARSKHQSIECKFVAWRFFWDDGIASVEVNLKKKYSAAIGPQLSSLNHSPSAAVDGWHPWPVQRIFVVSSVSTFVPTSRGARWAYQILQYRYISTVCVVFHGWHIRGKWIQDTEGARWSCGPEESGRKVKGGCNLDSPETVRGFKSPECRAPSSVFSFKMSHESFVLFPTEVVCI